MNFRFLATEIKVIVPFIVTGHLENSGDKEDDKLNSRCL